MSSRHAKKIITELLLTSITLSVGNDSNEMPEVAECSHLTHAVRTRTHRRKEIRRSIRMAFFESSTT